MIAGYIVAARVDRETTIITQIIGAVHHWILAEPSRANPWGTVFGRNLLTQRSDEKTQSNHFFTEFAPIVRQAGFDERGQATLPNLFNFAVPDSSIVTRFAGAHGPPVNTDLSRRPSGPVGAVQRTITDGLGDVVGVYLVHAFEICNGAADF